MEIQGSSIGPRLITENRDTAPGAPRQADTGKAETERGTGGGRVVLSDKARQMAAMRAEVDKAPEVRTGLVADLSQRIAAGTYDVRGRLVAEAMVRQAAFEAVA